MFYRFFPAALICGIYLLGSAPSYAQIDNSQIIKQMEGAFNKGQSAELTRLLPLAQGNILEPWAAYWELKARLEYASPEEIEAFLNRYAGTYQEDRLRDDWLQLLAENQDWAHFVKAYEGFRMRDDVTVDCGVLHVAYLNKEKISNTFLSKWLDLGQPNLVCARLAQTLLDSGQLQTQTVWAKARVAVGNNKFEAAKEAINLVEPDQINALYALYQSPETYLENHANAGSTAGMGFASLAFIRLAELDADTAVNLFHQGWESRFAPDVRDWLWGVFGKKAVQQMNPQAANYFVRASNDHLSDDLLAWKARAGLKSQNWKMVLDAITTMSASCQGQKVWVYWKARALAAMADPSDVSTRQQAKVLWAAIAAVDDFYGQLALEALGQPLVLPKTPVIDETVRDRVRNHPGLKRAIAAIELGLRSEGVREWNYVTNLEKSGGMNDQERLAAAELACSRMIWDRCINTSERTQQVVYIDQRFPMPFLGMLHDQAQTYGLDLAYVLGIVRQESRFVSQANSSVGAKGLMQLMPATAKLVAKKIGYSDFDISEVNAPAINLALGCAYLKSLLNQFNQSYPLATAAYNAGPNRARRWNTGIEGAIWAETIPFAETRDYVKKVLTNTTVYNLLLQQPIQPLSTRLSISE